jgi:hypothetical protein
VLACGQAFSSYERSKPPSRAIPVKLKFWRGTALCFFIERRENDKFGLRLRGNRERYNFGQFGRNSIGVVEFLGRGFISVFGTGLRWQ